MKAQVCPVCAGKGTVHDMFYTGLPVSSGGRTKCLSCTGRGIVFCPDEPAFTRYGTSDSSVCPKCRNTGMVTESIPNGMVSKSHCDACGRRQVAMNIGHWDPSAGYRRKSPEEIAEIEQYERTRIEVLP